MGCVATGPPCCNLFASAPPLRGLGSAWHQGVGVLVAVWATWQLGLRTRRAAIKQKRTQNREKQSELWRTSGRDSQCGFCSPLFLPANRSQSFRHQPLLVRPFPRLTRWRGCQDRPTIKSLASRDILYPLSRPTKDFAAVPNLYLSLLSLLSPNHNPSLISNPSFTSMNIRDGKMKERETNIASLPSA